MKRFIYEKIRNAAIDTIVLEKASSKNDKDYTKGGKNTYSVTIVVGFEQKAIPDYKKVFYNAYNFLPCKLKKNVI